MPQDSEDEPASKLIERTRITREENSPKRTKEENGSLQPVERNRTPFELPRGWAFAKFSELGEFGRGKSRHRPRNDSKLYKDGKYPLVQTGDVARANGVIRTYTGLYNEIGLAQSRLWPQGTLCITIAANIADSGLLGFPACIPDSVVGFIPPPEMGEARYFEYFMRTAKAHLLDFAPSTVQKNINLGILETVRIPLPPVKEMNRIVTKVDQLMALCNELEAKQRQQSEARERLSNVLLNKLLAAREPAEFDEHWQHICDHFDLLYDTPDTIGKLRQVILQLAVQGKLVRKIRRMNRRRLYSRR